MYVHSQFITRGRKRTLFNHRNHRRCALIGFVVFSPVACNVENREVLHVSDFTRNFNQIVPPDRKNSQRGQPPNLRGQAEETVLIEIEMLQTLKGTNASW